MLFLRCRFLALMIYGRYNSRYLNAFPIGFVAESHFFLNSGEF